MGREFDFDPAPLRGFTDYSQFVGLVRRFAVHLEQALFAQQAFDQRRTECRTDGVGTLDAQHRAIVGQWQTVGRGHQRQAGAQHQQE